MQKTALIFSSGEGTRIKDLSNQLGLPKQLFPLPDGSSIVGRLARSMSKSCDRIICTIQKEEYRQAYQKTFSELPVDVEIVLKEGQGEYVEIDQILKLVTDGNLIQTNGDLVFADGVVEKFIEDHGNNDFFFRGREGNLINQSSGFDIFNSRISVVPARDLKKFSTNKPAAFLLLVKSLILGRVEKIPTLFNVDTPEDYQKACDYFEALKS